MPITRLAIAHAAALWVAIVPLVSVLSQRIEGTANNVIPATITCSLPAAVECASGAMACAGPIDASCAKSSTPVTCLVCVSVGDLSMTPQDTVSDDPRAKASPRVPDPARHAPSRSSRPQVPPPKFG